jgi:hypothetical protein
MGTEEAIANPLINLWDSFVGLLPGLIAAIIIIAIGYVVAYVIGHAIRILLQKMGLDKQLAKAKLTQAVGSIRISALLGEITKWYIFIIFLQSGVDLLRLGTLSLLLADFVAWLPNVIAAILVVVFGLIIAHFVAMKIREHTEIKGVKITSNATKILILFIAVLIALEQIGIDISILSNAFLIILTGFVFGVALAIGLSFGLGTKGNAMKAWNKIRKYI